MFMKLSVMKALEQAWYKSNRMVWLLLPLSWLYCLISFVRRKLYKLNIKKSYSAAVPVVVVGNIVVGGSGKTPLLISLCEYLLDKGYKPGVVSRGYGGSFSGVKQLADDDSAELVGDEPLMIRQRTKVPLVVSADRVAAVEYLLANNPCDIVLSDDGLQHYRMRRDFEIAVVDAGRGLGNGFCLPAGPLRETASRLNEVDLVVFNGASADTEGDFPGQKNVTAKCHYKLEIVELSRLDGSESLSLEAFVADFSDRPIHAVAGIGNPSRFFTQMKNTGLTLHEHSFSDHHHYQQQDFTGWQQASIIMTEKDAVKCHHLLLPDSWQVIVRADMSESLRSQLATRLLPLLPSLLLPFR